MKKAHRSAFNVLQQSALWAALSLSIFGSAQALTLNRPIVYSKQGEALRATIDVSEISIAEQIELRASIASEEVYKAAKMEQPTVNGQALDVQVQLLRRDRGWPYLKITSKQTVSGNAVDLLIDIRWATGRLLRDVSLSLDESKTTVTQISIPGTASSSSSATSDTQQVNVKRGDTASELVAASTPESVSLEQMLVALLRNNPDAFVESNVNRLKEGALLTLPTEQEASAIARKDARSEILVQAKDFETYRSELAARAPGGGVPKVARDSTGKLDAKVENKNAKTTQDKLTLSKPSKKDAAVEEKIAQQREAQDVAARAAELRRNMTELGKIAAATVLGTEDAASGAAFAGDVLPVNAPASATETDGEWLNDLREHSLTPVGAGSLIALLVLVGLWRRRALNKHEDDIQDLPPLNVKFNLDLPEHDRQEPVEYLYIQDLAPHAHHAHDEDEDVLEEDHTHSAAQPPRPTMKMPDISLDLDDVGSPSPYQVRINLANELWNLGQLHTSRALMEEVANDASGADKAKALKWLAERG
jgi:FimV-like protein